MLAHNQTVVASRAPFLPRPPPSITASFNARRYTAATLRLSFRAITVVFVWSRASVFSMRSSSFVHGRPRVIFLPIVVPHAPMSPTNQRAAFPNFEISTKNQIVSTHFAAD
jgi:hypothetical protein